MARFIEKTLQKIDKLNRAQIDSIIRHLFHDYTRLEEVINSLPEGIVVLDEGHVPLLYNRSAHLMLRRDDHKGEKLWEVISDSKIARYAKEALHAGAAGDSAQITTEIGGEARVLDLSTLPLVRDGKIVGTIVRIVDSTAKIAEEVRLYRAEQLASLTNLTANVAHEIKNPLASISIYIQLIQRELAKEERARDDRRIAEHLTIVEEEIARLNSTIIDFLFAVRPMQLTLTAVDIHALLDDIITLLEPEVRARIHISKRDLATMPAVEGDKKYLAQAFINIIKNAIEAIPEEGAIEIRTALQSGKATIMVIDSGVGINNDAMARIFDPYFTTKEYGSGIGLTQVYKVIKEHRGDVRIENNSAGGATCTVTLPLARSGQRLLEGE